MADNALMRHRRMQETQRAFADQFDRPTPQDYPVVERGNTGTFTSSMLPIATYANGQTGLAWPGIIAEGQQIRPREWLIRSMTSTACTASQPRLTL